jgi:hypothetical protein
MTGILAPWTSTDPNIGDWVDVWLPEFMTVPPAAMPPQTMLQYCFDQSLNMALPELETVPSQPTSPSVYAVAVYNLGGDILCENAQDTSPSTFWTDLRKQLDVNAFRYGLVQSGGDQGSSGSLMIPESLQGLTLGDLQLTKTPWGQRYLQIAQYWGTIWGIT